MEKLENMFKQSFNSIKTLIRFKPMWLGGHDDFRRVVIDREHRLMLDVGRSCKFEDKHGTRYICIGTPFGIICARRAVMLGKIVIRYETTKELVKAFSYSVKTDVNFFQNTSGILGEHGFSYLLGEQIQQDLEVIAGMMREAGIPVGDGVLPPRIKEINTRPNKEIWDKAKEKRQSRQKEQQTKKVINKPPTTVPDGAATTNTSLPPGFTPKKASEKKPYVTVTA